MIDPSTNTVVATVDVSPWGSPVGVAVIPTGPEAGDVYVTDGSGTTVWVIDPSTNTVVDTVDVGTFPGGVAVSPTGPEAGDIYAANLDSSTFR